MKSIFPRLLTCALVLACPVPPAPARQQQAPAQQQQSQQPRQPTPARPPSERPAEPDEVLQVNTRVVFLDALVTDKKTRALAADLKAENFEVVADGRARELTYFSREGDAGRRPLALALVFDLRSNGAGRYLRRADILEAMARELAKLPPSDEVAVLALDSGGFGGGREWLSPFTRDRARTGSALASVPKLAEQNAAGRRAVGEGGPGSGSPGGGEDGEAARGRDENRVSDRGDKAEGATVTANGRGVSLVKLTAPNEEAMKAQLEELDKKHGRPGEVDEVDRYVDRKGRELTRTLKPDGTLLVQRVNPDGSVEVDVFDDTTLPRAVFDVTRRLARERPNSQAAIVYVTDGVAVMAYPERDYVEHRMLRQNAIFNALVTDMKTGFKLVKPLLAPLGNLIGLNIYGGAQHIAKETGGEALRVRRPADYAEGLARVVGNLSARYGLGFTLAEDERDDGRLHPLEVRARAKDAKGKERKLEVKTRRGYFMPVTKRAGPQPDAAKKADDPAEIERVKN
jgi:hypothetical protein